MSELVERCVYCRDLFIIAAGHKCPKDLRGDRDPITDRLIQHSDQLDRIEKKLDKILNQLLDNMYLTK